MNKNIAEGVLKNGEVVIILIRPSDNGKCLFHEDLET